MKLVISIIEGMKWPSICQCNNCLYNGHWPSDVISYMMALFRGVFAPDWQFILNSFNISNLGVEAVIPDIVQLSILTYFQATSLKISHIYVF